MRGYALTILVTLLASTTMQAQTPLTVGMNGYRDGDVITKQEIGYKSPGRNGSNVLWDMSEMENVNDSYRVSYWDVPDREDITAGTEHLTSYYYRQQGDTLLLAGYENNLTRVSYSEGEPLLHYPFALGDSIGGTFHGYGVDGESVYLRVFGRSSSKADAEGMLILPGGDTLRHVLRVHTIRTVGEELCSDVATESHLRLLTDSLQPLTADDVAARLGDGRPLLEEHTYRWYAPGYRYPVLETVAAGIYGEASLFATAYYYAPSEQETLTGDYGNEELRRNLAAAEGKGNGSGNTGGGSSEGGIARDLHFSYNVFGPDANGQVRVEYFNSMRADIACALFTVSGMVVDGGDAVSTASGSHVCTLSLSCQQPGIYLLNIRANGQTYSEKVAWR